MSSRSLASVSDLPGSSLPNFTYRIIRNAQKQLEFGPVEGSRALSDATRGQFYSERDPEKRMGLAVREFLLVESTSPKITLNGSLIWQASNTSLQSRTASIYSRRY